MVIRLKSIDVASVILWDKDKGNSDGNQNPPSRLKECHEVLNSVCNIVLYIVFSNQHCSTCLLLHLGDNYINWAVELLNLRLKMLLPLFLPCNSYIILLRYQIMVSRSAVTVSLPPLHIYSTFSVLI